MDTSVKIRIYDNHIKEKYDTDGSIMYEYFDEEWHRFSYTFDLRYVQILDFKDKILFNPDGEPLRATEVSLSTEKTILAAVSHETFEKTVWVEYLEKLQAYFDSINNS